MIRTFGYQASWDEQNSHLVQKTSSSFDSFSCFFCGLPQRIRSWGRSLCRENILGAAEVNKSYEILEPVWFNKRFDYNRNFECIPIQIRTPDHEELYGTLFENRQSQGEDIPTILCFSGRGTSYKHGSFDWLLEKADKIEQKYHVVMFEYRGIGQSTGKAQTINDLILDGDSIYQFVRDRLRISEGNIRTLGISLGGAISAELLSKHEACGNYVSLDSFQSIEQSIQRGQVDDELLEKNKFPSFFQRPWIQAIIKKIMIFFMKLFSWEIHAADAFEKIRAKKLVAHDLTDKIITLEASLMTGVVARDLLGETEIMSLKQKEHTKHEIPENWRHHGGPYEFYHDETGKSASKRILNFLVKDPVIAKQGPVSSIQGGRRIDPDELLGIDVQNRRHH